MPLIGMTDTALVALSVPLKPNALAKYFVKIRSATVTFT
jgi:hypothetical protein